MYCRFIPLIIFGFSLVFAKLQYRGADFSSLLQLEWTTYPRYAISSNKSSRPLERILHQHGVNLARIRVWTNGTYNLVYGLELARRIKAAGMELMVNLHYSDTWADIGHQSIPDGWPTDFDSLLARVYNYTFEVMKAFEAQGTPIQFFQAGNEINNGLLWPQGQLSLNGFAGASKLLHASALAVRRASPSTKIALHLADAWDQDDIFYFYDGIFKANEANGSLGCFLAPSDVDVMGFSFYPYYGTNATLENLKRSMTSVVSGYEKDIMILETNWPAECDTTATPLSEPSIPVNAEGQTVWVRDVSCALSDAGGDKALGVIYWEPGWIGNAALGSGCSDNLLVTGTGTVKKSMRMFLDL